MLWNPYIDLLISPYLVSGNASAADYSDCLDLLHLSVYLELILLLKGTVSWDRFQNFWQKFTELGLTKGRGWFLNFLEAPMILKRS